jgi:hypothetical protein
MPKLLRIPEVPIDDEGEEVQSVRQAKPNKRRREGTFIPKETLEVWYRCFPGNAVSKVFFLILTRAMRYDKGVAFLSIEEIMTATHLPRRTVNYALRYLKGGGFIRREGRFRISIPDSSEVKAKSRVNRSKLGSLKGQTGCPFKRAKFGPKRAKFGPKRANGLPLRFS